MPYIENKYRNILKDGLKVIADFVTTGGKLNYCFTFLCLRYIKIKGESYQNYSDCIAALECAKLELYRRQMAMYEDQKINDNGDLDV